jgi:hypothetical protein
MQVTGGGVGTQPMTGSGGFKSAAKFAALLDDENSAEDRKSA